MTDPTAPEPESPEIPALAAELRREFEALLDQLRRADDLVASIHPRWKAAGGRFSAVLRSLQADAQDPDDVFSQLRSLSGFDDGDRCMGWLQERLADMLGGWGGDLTERYAGQRFGWLEEAQQEGDR